MGQKVETVLADYFWRHFIRHFLPTFEAQQKWNTEKDDITVGTVVLIVDQQASRALWQVGTVKTVIPGIKTAVVQVKTRTNTRLVVQLIRMPALPHDTTKT